MSDSSYSVCDGTGHKDHAGVAIDACDHRPEAARAVEAALFTSLADVEDRLAKAFGIPAGERRAWRARIRNFQRCGLPRDKADVGPGRRTNYTEGDFRRLYYCLALNEVGVSPSFSVPIVTERWADLETAARAGGTIMIEPPSVFRGRSTGSAILLAIPRLI